MILVLSVEAELSVSPSPGTVPGDQQQLWLEVLWDSQWTLVGKKNKLKNNAPENQNLTILENAQTAKFSPFSGGFVCLFVYIYYVHKSYRSIIYYKYGKINPCF